MRRRQQAQKEQQAHESAMIIFTEMSAYKAVAVAWDSVEIKTDVELWRVSLAAGMNTNFRGNVEVVEDVGDADGVDVEESDPHAEGV